MKRFFGLTLILIGAAGCLLAVGGNGSSYVPEIDPSSAAGALAMLTGAVLVLRGRKK